MVQKDSCRAATSRLLACSVEHWEGLMKSLFGLLLAFGSGNPRCYPDHPTSECGHADFGRLLWRQLLADRYFVRVQPRSSGSRAAGSHLARWAQSSA